MESKFNNTLIDDDKLYGSNRQVDYYRDPIHNYLAYTVSENENEITEKTLISSRWIQRLRRIFQLQCAWLVYPGAKHSRFLHVMGVMNLAGKFASHLWNSYVEAHGINSIPSKNYVVETCRLAGLLHDVGHGPMGHTLDEIYAKNGYECTHEDIGRKIILEELNSIIIGINSFSLGIKATENE